MIVDNNACNDKCFTALILSSFSNLKVFEVGDYCFAFVEEVKLIGLSKLEMVVIGNCCFRKNSQKNPNRHFYLKDCERLRELKIGRFSFSDYSVCEVENVPSLEVIEMGDLNEWSFNCERVKELKMGLDSFSDYSVCEIENVPSFEVIEMGDLDEVSKIFRYASLELKSDSERME